ncbi:Pyruvate ferredoxin/flavodoxin oxidoreductase [Syntrophobacter sp. SbD1]|nr:Pyruvate ferredoxin/flavodoxin oxidoreductase [Syntrophobacter sp. SbD1]
MRQGSQQIIISGLGGQGVLFITRLLADAALKMGRSILISETHGMAQRGGNVISHLKIGPEDGQGPASPLIRPGRADIILSLHPEAMQAHGHYLKTDGEAFCNNSDPHLAKEAKEAKVYTIDATGIAASLNSPLSANLVLLGFAAASGKLFCEPAQVESALGGYGEGTRLDASLRAFRAGQKTKLGE